MEAPMKKTFLFAAAAALLMASSAAQARGISFNIEGQKVRIEAPRHCMSLSCILVMNNGVAMNMKGINARRRSRSDTVEVASNAPDVPTAPAVQAPAAPAPVSNVVPPAPSQVAANNVLPESTRSTAERIDKPSAPPSPAAPAPATAANAAPSTPAASPVRQEAAAPATTPLGLWRTDEGNVRVEQCGVNLCGYGEKDGKKSNELVLINMRPSADHSKWSGRIHNPNTGKNYDGTMAMSGPNVMRIQGCILGGVFCGGTTWKRAS
jgi:uncharacterized protein (DUF2147 family)